MDALLSDFAAMRWKTKPFERLIERIQLDPLAADAFAEAVLMQVPKGGTFLDLTLSFVTEPAFAHLVSIALQRLARDPEENAASAVIAYASLQFPRLLHPHLARLFTLAPNAGTYYENWPWRESGALCVPHLSDVLNGADDGDRFKAWQCLLESRDPAVLQLAMNAAASVALRHPAAIYLHEVGFEAPAAPLFAAEPWHLVFPSDYFKAPRVAWNDRTLHPTWSLSGESVPCRFGGETAGGCSLCSGSLHHLVTVPSRMLGALDLVATVSFAACLSCLGWERPVLYYSHGAGGDPVPLDTGTTTPQFPAVALNETTIQLVASPARWRWQDWAQSNGRENLNRVGGHPSWIQSSDYPSCPTCSRVMHFALQLDSDLPQSDTEWMWGSGGICYAFWCAPCRVSAVHWQCT
jgi:hypothetical protein